MRGEPFFIGWEGGHRDLLLSGMTGNRALGNLGHGLARSVLALDNGYTLQSGSPAPLRNYGDFEQMLRQGMRPTQLRPRTFCS